MSDHKKNISILSGSIIFLSSCYYYYYKYKNNNNNNNNIKRNNIKLSKSHVLYDSNYNDLNQCDLKHLTVEEVKRVFYAAADGGLLDPHSFGKVCDELGISLGDNTIERIFERLINSSSSTTTSTTAIISPAASIKSSPSGSIVTRIDFETFLRAVRREKFMSNIVSYYNQKLIKPFDVPDNYDYNLSTEEQYSVDHMDFYGDYIHIRKTLDYSYHNNYCKERQLWQDLVIKNVVTRQSTRQARPWIIYSCGAMGSGKGYVLSWLSEHNYLPLEYIVHIDPDSFKRMMPEWKTYVKKDPLSAGTLAHKESAYMIEIAQEAALQYDQNIWIDSSLRDGKWYSMIFDRIRNEYPHYRIAIIYVKADEHLVRERVKKRAKETGRDIPEQLIQASLDAPDRSLGILTPKCDFIARILNNSRVPILLSVETIDRSGHFESIRKRFNDALYDYREFPNSLAPLYLHPILSVDIDKDMFDVSDIKDEYIFVNYVGKMRCSKYYHLNNSITSRELVKIPSEAKYFVFVYPLEDIDENIFSMIPKCVIEKYELFFKLGGFIYFSFMENNVSPKIHGINAVSPNRGKENYMLQFGNRRILSPKKEWLSSKKWCPITIPYMLKRGATHFMWINPHETPSNECGAFVYRYYPNDDSYEQDVVLFPVLGANN